MLAVDPIKIPPALLLLGVVCCSLFQTGLFIVGHDAMHGLLLPAHPRLNHRLGALVLALYASLPYGRCRDNHLLHHLAPGSQQDPDFCPSGFSPFRWYVRFLSGYLRPAQMLRLLAAWGVLALVATPLQVLLFCTLPLLLSSVQLFVVGTYLPHRLPCGPDDPHHAISLDLPEWLSLLACFHFGYHREHHAFPELAWYQLPLCRRTRGSDGYTIKSSSWNPHHPTGLTKSRPWPRPPLRLPTAGPSMG
ncbi:MAG: fatty acid desaturase [Prochlorococcaceae cyanobacterium]